MLMFTPDKSLRLKFRKKIHNNMNEVNVRNEKKNMPRRKGVFCPELWHLAFIMRKFNVITGPMEGTPPAKAPLRPKIFSISCSFFFFLKIWKIYFLTPLEGLPPSPTGNPGSDPDNGLFNSFSGSHGAVALRTNQRYHYASKAPEELKHFLCKSTRSENHVCRTQSK